MPDFFLDDLDQSQQDAIHDQIKGTEAFRREGETGLPGGGPAKTFQAIKGLLNTELVNSIGAVFAFHLSGNLLLKSELLVLFNIDLLCFH